ncbi:zinc finger, C3HC4 type, domain containing protein [Musa troglodytarum]|uniref:Zinc finger, C3HC4 type, domain containing protein n=1 Tax=Musa troglodytarum TaxID=320322 RepID=A0A9E7HKA5_9LILI|nr:zinc finger, C3HC4 type, domain containing protein [Musa troglodytarum]
MGSPVPLDSDIDSELLSALDTLGVDKNMEDMEHDLVLEVPDSPDKPATRCTVNDCSRTSGTLVDLDKELVASSDQKVAPAAKIDAHHCWRSNVYEVARCSTARDNNSHLRLRGSLANTHYRNHFLPNKGKVLDSDQEKIVKSTGLYQQISSHVSYPAQCMDLRRNNEQEVSSQGKNINNCVYTGLLGEKLSQQNSYFGRLETGSRFPLEPGDDAGNVERDKGKGKRIDSSSDPQVTSEELPRQLLPSRFRRNMTQKRLVRNGVISPNNIAKSKISSKVDGLNIMKSFAGETCSLLTDVSHQDYKKKSVTQSSSRPDDRPTKVVKGRIKDKKLVHNGCIASNNVKHGKSVMEDDSVGNVLSGGNSAVQVEIVSPNPKEVWPDQKKGKEILNASKAQNVRRIEVEPQFDRECLKSRQEVTSVTVSNDDTLEFAKAGQRALKDHKGKAPVDLSCQSASVSNSEETIGQLLDQKHENEIVMVEADHVNLLHDNPEIIFSHQESNSSMVYVTSESESENGRCHRRQKQKPKRKCNAVRSHFGESSSFPLEGFEKSYIQSYTEASNPKSIRCHNAEWHGEILGRRLEVDKISSPRNFQENGCGHYNAIQSQVESDEILARQLQEQFYHELPGSEGTEESDASIAWSLQQEEDDRYVASSRRNLSHPRDASMAHLFVHGPRPSFRSYSQQLTNRARVSVSGRVTQFRRNFNSPDMDLEMSIIAELRRNFNNGEMDLETRLNFLEALETAFENEQETEILDDTLLVQRDITEDDYEMLLGLDEDNHQHSGASESQINILPESVIQSNGNVEACVICLEPPTVGDVIRHLPCLHKFHKECIDTWLRRKTLCPVCKSGIS